MTRRMSVLIASDVKYGTDRLGKIWVDSLVSTLVSRGWTVHILAREVDGIDRYDDIWSCGGLVITPGESPLEHQDVHGLKPRFRARTLIAEVEELNPDLVLVQGLALSRFVAGSGRLDSRLWTIPLDRPYAGGRLDRDSFADLKKITEASARILVADEVQRSTLDAEFPTASSKVRVLPLPDDAVEVSCSDSLNGVADLHIHEGLFADADVELFKVLAAQLRERREIPRMLIHEIQETDGAATTKGASSSKDASTEASPDDLGNVPRELPGALVTDHEPAGGWELLPNNELARHYGHLLAQFEDRTPVSLEPTGRHLSEAQSFTSEHRDQPNPFDEAAVAPIDDDRLRPVRLVIAGSDFKFAGDLVESFLADDSFDVRFDIFKHHAHAQPQASEPYLEWADVILAEFAVQNAIWYSHNLAPHQTLIVHLHGFELLSEWITELDIDKVATVVVASEFYRQKAHELRGWPLSKIQVVPNSVNHFDFHRPKYDDARFHLGLVGMVPILKRPDRALDLLESLLEVDPRYTLHIRGHAPWNYSWEWKKAAHQDAYRDFYSRVGDRPELLQAIAFEPFAPDMANWLRKIGWLLSPSSRETFHLAAIEGAMSGSVPLAWERDGAREIIGDDWTFSSTQEIRDFVVAHNDSPDAHRLLANRAQAHAARFKSDTVGRQWRRTVLTAHEGTSSAVEPEVPQGVAGTVYREIDALVRAGDFDEAKGVLDRHIAVTKDDTSRLKLLEMFVRGLLALDSRRIDLIPPFQADSSQRISVEGPTPDFALPGDGAWTSDRYVRISSLNTDAGPGQLLADPRIVVGSIGVVPFGYTGEEPGQREVSAALRTVAGAARSTSTFSGPVVTDALEKHFDVRIAIDGNLRFDRWAEIVASEVSDHLAEFPQCGLLIDAPWHLALPAAIAAGRAGVPFVWVPPIHTTHAAVEKLKENPYSGDLVAQFVGALVSRAAAVVVPPNDDSPEVVSHTLFAVPNLIIGNTQHSPGAGTGEHTAIIFDASTAAEIADLNTSPRPTRALGALNTLPPRRAWGDQPLRLAIVADHECAARLSRTGPLIEATPLVHSTDLDPSFDVLVVDESALTDPHVIPGEGTPVQRVRALFDLARSFGVVGIFNADTHVGGDRSVSTMAEKADVVTGTRAVLTVGLMGRNPNSITRVGSASVDSDSASEVLSALAAVGIGSAPAQLRYDSGPAEYDDSALGRTPAAAISGAWDATSLHVKQSDGVSIVVATRLGAKRLPVMLGSIAAQSMHLTRMELIIVHNGPQDGTDVVIQSFARENPQLAVRFLHSEVEGASEARNMGLQAVSLDYVTFIDDDDEVESNYILNMWLSADENVIVAAPLRDVSTEGVSHTDIPNNRRLANLAGRRTQLTRASGLLGLNACKLIPAHVARNLHYPTGMRSGEDVAFMSQLLLHGLELVPADTAPNSAYIRHMRPDSVSRRLLTRDFAVDQRLAVISHLEAVRAKGPSRIEGCVRALQMDQLSFVSRYVAENPTEGETAIEQVLRAGIPTALLKDRYRTLHSLANRLESAAV